MPELQWGGNNRNSQINPQSFSPADGDILLAPASPKKSKKPLFIVLAIIAVLLIGALVAFIIYSNNNKNTNSYTEPSDLKGSFNSYVNYVAFGTNTSEDVSLADISITSPYFTKLYNADQSAEQNAARKAEYLTAVSEKYNNFMSIYYQSGGDIELTPLRTYYHDYASIPNLTEEDILKEYLNNGIESTRQYIARSYGFSGADNYLGIYLDDSEDLADATLSMLIGANGAGCIANNTLIQGCYTMTEEEASRLNGLLLNTIMDTDTISNRAANNLSRLYLEIYNQNQDSQGNEGVDGEQ